MSGVEAAAIGNLGARQRYHKARGRLYVPGISANARVNEWTLANIVENSRELEMYGFRRTLQNMRAADALQPLPPRDAGWTAALG